MARTKISEEEKTKRKMARRAAKKVKRKEAKLAKMEAKVYSDTDTRKVKTKGNTDGIIVVEPEDKKTYNKMQSMVEEGTARRYGYNMGAIMFIINNK